MEVPSRAGALGRRQLLWFAALAPATVAAVAGCQSKPDEPDALARLADSARADAAFAQAVASKHSGLADKAGAIATARSEHARGLQREIDRKNPPTPDTPPLPQPAARPVPSSAGAATDALAEALRNAQKSVGDMVVSAPQYRAGLLGSVAASCASLQEVLGE